MLLVRVNAPRWLVNLVHAQHVSVRASCIYGWVQTRTVFETVLDFKSLSIISMKKKKQL